MSCQACQQAQAGSTSAYFRWGNANIEMRGCAEHLREVIHALAEWQRINAVVERSLGPEPPTPAPDNFNSPDQTLADRLRRGGKITDWTTRFEGGRSFLILTCESGLEAVVEIR